jgi:predicted nucleic-acid-binding protein
MKITPDTNVLVRVLVEDDARQSTIAESALSKAEMVALATPALCELVWVLSRGYKLPGSDIAEALRRILASANVVVNRPAVDAGLGTLDQGGDFADGVIAYEGKRLGAETFVSFDKKAIKLAQAAGETARLLA